MEQSKSKSKSSSSSASLPPSVGDAASSLASLTVNPVPGPSQAAVSLAPGHVQPTVNPVAGLSQPAINPAPGPSQAAVNPAPGPSQPYVNPAPGLSQPAVNPVPGPSQPAVNPAPGPSQPAVNPAPGPSQPAVKPAPGPSQPPEAVWLPFIQQLYPNRYQQTYFLPPIFFRRQYYTVQHIDDEDIIVPQSNPPPRPLQPLPAPQPQPTPQVAGSLFTAPSPGLEQSRHQDSDMQDDQAQQSALQCLQVLSDNLNQAMVVVSQLMFRKYLDNCTNPVESAAAARLPGVRALPVQLRDGEGDIVVLHRQQGVIVGEIKSVGGSSYFQTQPQSQQHAVIAKKVEVAVKQVNNQATALRHLVSDLNITVTKTLILPNLKSSQLLQALASTPAAQALLLCVGGSSLQDAVDRCLCADAVQGMSLPALTAWWQCAVLNAGPDPSMTDHVYDRLLARFCGPATTVEVYSAMSPPRAIRTEGEATAETGLHFSRLCLTQGQLDLLRQPDYDHTGSGIVYLCAPPGCGKTLMLVLKGLQWLNQGRHVQVVSMRKSARAVSSLLARTLRQNQRTAATVTTHYADINSLRDIPPLVTTLASLPTPASVLLDEADRRFLAALCRDLHLAAPDTCLWVAGIFHFRSPPPPCVRVVDWLTSPLRCPPAVQREVAWSGVIGGNTPDYSQEDWPSPTDGPAVRWLQHHGQPGHGGDGPRDCQQCGLEVGHLLHHLRDRQSGLEWRDVLILCDDPSAATGLTRGLTHAVVPVTVVDSRTATPHQLEDVGAAMTDQVTVTDRWCVSGLERRVVVGVEGWGMADRRDCMSRCTGLLMWIGTAGYY